MSVNTGTRRLLLAAGFLFLGLAIFGAVLPLVPSTPFLLVASFCFARSSETMNRWFRSRPFIARRLEKWEQGQGLSAKDKVGVFVLASALVIPVAVLTPSLHLKIFLGVLMAGKALFLVLWKPGRRRELPRPARGWALFHAAASMGSSLGNVGLYALAAWALTRGPDLGPNFWFWAPICLLAKVLLAAAARATVPRASRSERTRWRQVLTGVLWKTGGQSWNRDQGAQAALLTDGIDSLALYRGLYIPQLFAGIVTPLAILAAVAHVDPVSALVLLVLVPVTPLVIGALQSRFRKATTRYREVNGTLTGRFQEGILGLPDLRLFGASGAWGRKIDDEADRHRRAALGLLAVNQLLILVLDLTASLGLILGSLVLAVTRYQAGAVDAFTAVFLVLVSLELIRPQQLMGAFFFAGGFGRATLKAARALTEGLPASVQEPGDTPGAPTVLEARNLTFSYPSGESLGFPEVVTLTKGVLTGLAGPSGTGKTTLRRLLTGVLRPTGGQILADGRDKTSSGSDLARYTAVADQHPYLFSGTVGTNLRYAAPGAPEDRMREVLESVGLGPGTGLDLDTQIGEEGRLLSGGQRSRLSLARALLTPAPFLILDEPSADLDPETEALVLAVAREESATRGVLLITHRPQLLNACDRILEVTPCAV